MAASGADTLIVAGVHVHGCVRATVLDAYARGFVVVPPNRKAGDAGGSAALYRLAIILAAPRPPMVVIAR